jgi:hypothetical protein
MEADALSAVTAGPTAWALTLTGVVQCVTQVAPPSKDLDDAPFVVADAALAAARTAVATDVRAVFTAATVTLFNFGAGIDYIVNSKGKVVSRFHHDIGTYAFVVPFAVARGVVEERGGL